MKRTMMNITARAHTLLIGVIAWSILSAVSVAGELPRAEPEEIGLSGERLSKLTETIRSDVARKEIPGAVLLIARHGKIGYLESFGELDPNLKTPMPSDAIFRIYSMSKPITSAAAMILVEDGKIGLDDPVSDYLPEFKNVRVAKDATAGVELDPAKLTGVAADRPITIQDLMRHTSGLAYGFIYRTPIQKLYARAGLWDDQLTNAEFSAKIAQSPLARQPGTAWEYGHSTDVLGRLIEVVSGTTLLEFEKERILDPLEMDDTSFYVSEIAKHARVAEPFEGAGAFGDGEGRIEFSDPRLPKKWESGGAGMVSTAGDYAQFLQMLVNGGALDGRRILGPKTVAYMTADHLGAEITQGPLPGYGWSLGFAVRREAGVAPMPGSIGDYFWLGAGGTSFFVDPKEDLLVVFMMQQPSKMDYYHGLTREMVYASIID